MCKVSAERPYKCPLPYLSNARLCSSWMPVPVDIVSTTIAKGRPFWYCAESVPEGANRLVSQRYKQFACRVNQPASSWVLSVPNGCSSLCPTPSPNYAIVCRFIRLKCTSFAGVFRRY